MNKTISQEIPGDATINLPDSTSVDLPILKKVNFELPIKSDDLVEIEIIHTVAEWEKIEAELGALRAKLRKAEAVIRATVNLIDDYGYALGKGAEDALQALREYRGETK